MSHFVTEHTSIFFSIVGIMAMNRRFFVGGNWKMNGSVSFSDSMISVLTEGSRPQDVGEC